MLPGSSSTKSRSVLGFPLPSRSSSSKENGDWKIFYCKEKSTPKRSRIYRKHGFAARELWKGSFRNSSRKSGSITERAKFYRSGNQALTGRIFSSKFADKRGA